MKSKVCNNCGCTSFISDRSLGGRIVCRRCGSYSFRNKSSIDLKNKNILFISLFLVILMLILLF